jgi:potassium large conductance calcium-activated channel subfamily M alpha protein 1
MSKPFASGEIYVSSLLDSLMCQAFYSPKITEFLDQMLMGQANTPEKVMKIYR